MLGAEKVRHDEKEGQYRPKLLSKHLRNAYAQIRGDTRQLFTAMAAERAGLTGRLAPFIRTIFTLSKVAVVGVMLVLLTLATAMLWILCDVPLERARMDGASVLVEAADGKPLGRVGSFGDAVSRRDFPDILVSAVTSIEDRRFYSHWGVDLRGICGDIRELDRRGDRRGGSTITQQLAKMEIVGAERNMNRKLREAFIAIWLELRIEKDEILTRYLNTAYLGAGTYGMSAAARMYFDKSLAELTLPEAALLAGPLQAPSKYNPVRNLNAAHTRAARVIDALLDAG